MPPNIPTVPPSDYFRGLRNIFNGALADRLGAALGQQGDSFRIESVEDFPDPVNNVITLAPGQYNIIGIVDIGTNKLLLNAVGPYSFLGSHRDHSKIISSNTDEAILINSGFFRCDRLWIQNLVGDAIRSAVTSNMTINQSIVAALATGKVAFNAPSGGSTLITLVDSFIQGDLFGVNVGAGSLRLRMSSCDILASSAAVGNRAFRIDSTATVLSAMISDCRFSGGGDFSVLVNSSATFTSPVHFVACSADGFGTAGLDTGGEVVGANLTVTATDNF